jgi:glycosyltransferase involved in cell wall biosynthesis
MATRARKKMGSGMAEGRAGPAEEPGAKRLRFSIIISNYNYAAYLADSIDSALAVAWPDKEVIVVDDGSTDGSRDIIAGYGGRVLALMKPNGGQNDALNAGLARASGDAVITLDSDDVLLPSVAAAAARVWRPGVSVVQYGIGTIDREGKCSGAIRHAFSERDTPDAVRSALRRTGWYQATCSTANVWSRAFLDEVAPLPTRDRDGLLWFDDFLHFLAPFFGDVVCLHSVEAYYRMHSRNSHWVPDYEPVAFAPDHSVHMCRQDLLRAALVDAVLREKKGTNLAASGVTWDNFLYHMTNRLISRRFRAARYPIDEAMPTVLRKYLRALRHSDYSQRSKALHAGWAAAVAFAPYRVAAWACEQRARRPSNRGRANYAAAGAQSGARSR